MSGDERDRDGRGDQDPENDADWEHLDDDERFEQIVAGLREEDWARPADGAADHRGADPDEGRVVAGEPDPPRTPTPDPVASLPSQWRVSGQDAADLLPPESHEYQPPEPDPLPAGDLGFWGALLGTVGGPLFLLYLVFFDREARPLWWVLGGVITITGLTLIVLRQPDRRDNDWDDDVDGAVL